MSFSMISPRLSGYPAVNAATPTFGALRKPKKQASADSGQKKKKPRLSRTQKAGGGLLVAVLSMLGISQGVYGNPWELSKNAAETAVDAYYKIKYRDDADENLRGIPAQADAVGATTPDFSVPLQGIEPVSWTQNWKLNHGIDFQHFELQKDNSFKRVRPDDNQRNAETILKHQLVEIYRQNPKVLATLLEESNGLEIQLYHGASAVGSKDSDGHWAGTATHEGGQKAIVRMLSGPLGEGIENNGLLAHEMAHVDDQLVNFEPSILLKIIEWIANLSSEEAEQMWLANSDGFLPGKSDAENRKMAAAREEEKAKIAALQSPMNGKDKSTYALTNDMEFLAVLRTTYLETPEALRESNPVLYRYTDSFYNSDRVADADLLLGGGGVLLLIGGKIVRIRRKRRKQGK